jgi:hypothetical protein
VSRSGTKLVVAPPSAPLDYGQPAQLTGELRSFSRSASVADVPVELQRQTTGGSFKTVAKGGTDDSGRFTLSFAPSKRSVVRVHFPGDAAHRASQSRPVTVQVRPTLTFATPASRVRLGALIDVAGTLAPRKSSLRLIVERRSGRGKKGRIATKRVAVSGGRFNARFRLRGAGLFRMQLFFLGDKDNLPVQGKAFFVRAAKGAPAPPAGTGGGTAPRKIR